MMNSQFIYNRALSKQFVSVMLACFPLLTSGEEANPNNLPPCPAELITNWYTSVSHWHNCFGKHNYGDKIKYKNNHINRGYYQGEYRSGYPHGFGKSEDYQTPYQQGKGNYVGQWSNGEPHGLGILIRRNDKPLEGIWNHGRFMEHVTITSLPHDVEKVNKSDNSGHSNAMASIDNLDLALEKRQREQKRRSQRMIFTVSNTQPASDGSFTINVETNTDTASLKINGNEEGGSSDGKYSIKRIARAGQTTTFNIVAIDVYGNTDTKTITVSRQVVESKAAFAALNPANIKKQVDRDAVAVVIGIADYRSLPRAEFANDDARAFYDYAIRALGIKPENIKLLVDGDAEEAEILRTFKNWLPTRVKSTTDVYVFYSGHGLPMPDGKGLYLVPQRAARDLIDDTAIPFSKINAALTLAKPKSVTIFLDSCYSGQARSGETLVASARPVQLKSDSRYFPENFTVITASQNDQISSSNPELQHGIFSYYLMKGMEGDADTNKDGKITLGEMQAYLSENVGRQAAMMSRKQEPQLIGDANRVLVGK